MNSCFSCFGDRGLCELLLLVITLALLVIHANLFFCCCFCVYRRASGVGDKRSPMDLGNIYNVRKRYSALYYQFKPGFYYWTVIIIARKFAIAAINLMLRSDVDYMLAASLLIMFVAFSVQLLNRPFMGPVRSKIVFTSQYIRPYCETCFFYCDD